MKMYSDVKELLDRCENQLRTLSSIAKDEEKEYGKINEDTVLKFNAIMYAIANAGDILENGLEGKYND